MDCVFIVVVLLAFYSYSSRIFFLHRLSRTSPRPPHLPASSQRHREQQHSRSQHADTVGGAAADGTSPPTATDTGTGAAPAMADRATDTAAHWSPPPTAARSTDGAATPNAEVVGSAAVMRSQPSNAANTGTGDDAASADRAAAAAAHRSPPPRGRAFPNSNRQRHGRRGRHGRPGRGGSRKQCQVPPPHRRQLVAPSVPLKGTDGAATPNAEVLGAAAVERWPPPPSALPKSPKAAQRSPNGRPVGPNLEVNVKPWGSVGAQRGRTEPQRTPFSLGLNSPFARSGHMFTSIKSRQDHLKDNKVYLTEKTTLISHN